MQAFIGNVCEEIKVLPLLLDGTKQFFSFLTQLIWWFSAGKVRGGVSFLIVAPQVETSHTVTALTGTVLVWSFILMFLLFPLAIVGVAAVPMENMLLPLRECENALWWVRSCLAY